MEQVNEKYKKLEEENLELKTVLKKLSHEMGNALTLLGASIFYLETDIANDMDKCDITDIKNDYTYICSLFKELREYNHTEATLKKEIKVGDFVNVIEKSCLRMVGNEKILLNIDKQNDMENRTLYVDVTKLRQSIINIIKNCIDAMRDNDVNKGKKIGIAMKIESGLDNVMLNENKDSLYEVMHIEIRDNGKGIPEENINNIFKPMYTYGKKDGTGLGLAIVKKIVEEHNGMIKAVSALGTGTAIHIYLPLLV